MRPARSLVICVVLSVFITGCVSSRYSVGSAEFVLKSGSTFTNTASKVETWGIWMSDGSSVLYRQLTRITTKSVRLADQIVEAIPDVAVDTTSAGFLFDLTNIEFAGRPPAPPRVGLLADKRMHVGGHLGPFAGIDAHVGVVPSRAEKIQVTLGTSIAWNVLGLGESPGRAGFFGGFAAGIEYTDPVGSIELGFAARVWKRYARHAELRGSGPEPTVGLDAASLGLLSVHRLSDQFSVSLELRGYLWDETYDGYKSRAALIVALRRSVRTE